MAGGPLIAGQGISITHKHAYGLGEPTISIYTGGAKNGSVLTVDGTGVCWKDPAEIFPGSNEPLRQEIPAVEEAYQRMVDAIKNFNMIVKLYREDRNGR